MKETAAYVNPKEKVTLMYLPGKAGQKQTFTMKYSDESGDPSSVFLSWPTVNNCDLFVSGREQMSAGMGNARQRLRTRGEKMHTISWWQPRRQFSVSFPASVKRHCPRQRGVS